jgi:ABC-type glycerol-3-phosphate transport system substrate-binding protein
VLFSQASASIAAGCANPAEAWKFIVWEAQPKWAGLRASVAKWLPLRRDLLDDPEIRRDPDLVAFLQMAEHSRAYPLPSPIWADIGANDIAAAVQKAILNPDDVEKIFRDLDSQLTRKLKEG